MSGNEKTLVEFIERVWNAGDVSVLAAYLADSYTIHHDPGDPWEKQTLSMEGFAERVRVSRAPVPDQEFEIQTMFSKESEVCITWRWRGTHLGEISGFAPTGQKISMSGATVYYFDNGKIAGHWQIADRFGVYQQLVRNAEMKGG